MENKITYEQPLNERMRTLLRLEHLKFQVQSSLGGESKWDSRNTVASLLDIQNLFGRTDIKTDILKELERLASVLEQLGQNPNVDDSKLTSVLDEIDVLIDQLHNIQGPVGQQLRKNELLNGVRQRSSIAGGTCAFDLPSYHFWLQQPAETRNTDLQTWLEPFEPILRAGQLMLRLIRECSPSTTEVANDGFFQKTLDPSTPCHLVRVEIPRNYPYYAEISGGKHRFSVRFLELKWYERDTATSDNVEFTLTCSSL